MLQKKKYKLSLFECFVFSRQLRVVRCQLCSLDITTVRDLVIHLDSEKHQRKEEELRQGRF